ncbi:MAG: LON peptidase substrate-binding domain-containing protein, partial [Clostridia bacterium]
MEDKKLILPLIPLRGLTVFPTTTLNFDVGRKKSLQAVEESAKNYNGMMVLVSQKFADIASPRRDDIENFGVIAHVVQLITNTDESVRVVVEALKRIKLVRIAEFEPIFMAEYTVAKDTKARTAEAKAYQRKCLEVCQEHYFIGERINKEMMQILNDTQDTVSFLNRTAHLFNVMDKQ